MSHSRHNAGDTTAYSVVNSRDTADFAANAVFQGEGEDVGTFGRAAISITTKNKTNGTLFIEVSRDGETWSGPPRSWSDTRFAQPHMWQIVERYFRIKYVNGTTPAVDLNIQVQYSNDPTIILGHQLNEVLIDDYEAIATRAVLAGKDTDGVYRNVQLTIQGELLTAARTAQSDQLLTEILKELKIMNLYNAMNSDTHINREDVEV